MTSPLFPIGKLSTGSGVKVPTIRFYEQSGLLPTPPRTASDRRLYDDAALRRLAFIRHARQLGFDLDAIRSLLDLSDLPDHNCEEANRIAFSFGPRLHDGGEGVSFAPAIQRDVSKPELERPILIRRSTVVVWKVKVSVPHCATASRPGRKRRPGDRPQRKVLEIAFPLPREIHRLFDAERFSEVDRRDWIGLKVDFLPPEPGLLRANKYLVPMAINLEAQHSRELMDDKKPPAV